MKLNKDSWVTGLKGVCLNAWLSQEGNSVKDQFVRKTHSFVVQAVFVLLPLVKVCFAVMSLCLKTQKRVLSRSSGASRVMASRLLEHIVVQHNGYVTHHY